MGCLDNPRGQILLELVVSLFIVCVLSAGFIAFLLLEDYQFSFQIGNIVFMYFESTTLTLFYRARTLRYLSHGQLLKYKPCIKIFLFLQITSICSFISIIIYCLVELSSPVNFWVDFNNVILENNFSGNASFFLIFSPIHIYYIRISRKLKKLLLANGDEDAEIDSFLLQQQQLESNSNQERIKTASVLSQEFPQEIKYDSTCSICQDDIFNEKIVSFSCQHIFHSSCIRSWLKTKKNTCPNCRSSIVASCEQTDRTTVLQSQTDNHLANIQSHNN